MNDKQMKFETIDIEEVIMAYNQEEITRNLPFIESDEEAAISILQEQSGEPLAYVDAHYHHQIDPSYQ